MRKILVAVVAMLLTGCDGSGGGGAPVTNPTPSPTPTPTPTPTPVPGVVATMTVGTIPGLAPADILNKAEASNQGLYVVVLGSLASGLRADKIVKLQGDPSTAAAWTIIFPEPDGYIGDFAVANPYSEQNGDIDFYYIEHNFHTTRPIGGTLRIWGRYSTIPGMSARSTMEIVQTSGSAEYGVAAGAPVGSASQRSWLLSYSQSAYIYTLALDGGTGTGRFDRFSQYPKPTITDLNAPSATILAHPTLTRLYAAIGKALYVYDANTLLMRYPLQDTPASTDTMLFYDDALYVGHYDAIWRLAADGTFTRLLTKDPQENFCITGGEIYLAKGGAVNLQTMAHRDWISTGTLTASQSAEADNIRGTAPYSIYCSASAGSPLIYAISSGSQQIRAIKPLTP